MFEVIEVDREEFLGKAPWTAVWLVNNAKLMQINEIRTWESERNA
jgi:hypothetical protein